MINVALMAECRAAKCVEVQIDEIALVAKHWPRWEPASLELLKTGSLAHWILPLKSGCLADWTLPLENLRVFRLHIVDFKNKRGWMLQYFSWEARDKGLEDIKEWLEVECKKHGMVLDVCVPERN